MSSHDLIDRLTAAIDRGNAIGRRPWPGRPWCPPLLDPADIRERAARAEAERQARYAAIPDDELLDWLQNGKGLIGGVALLWAAREAKRRGLV